uniref:Uncharacterized protein n=1 Tax=Glossina palpalis gambiensis TaxID=67801 RepID=A0A1B0B1U6_9MUSC
MICNDAHASYIFKVRQREIHSEESLQTSGLSPRAHLCDEIRKAYECTTYTLHKSINQSWYSTANNSTIYYQRSIFPSHASMMNQDNPYAVRTTNNKESIIAGYEERRVERLRGFTLTSSNGKGSISVENTTNFLDLN